MRVILLLAARVSLSFNKLSNLNPTAAPAERRARVLSTTKVLRSDKTSI